MLKRKPSFPSFLDIIYWVAIASLVLARYIDVQVLKGQTAYGESATMRHWRNYATLVTGIATVAWLGVRALIWL